MRTILRLRQGASLIACRLNDSLCVGSSLVVGFDVGGNAAAVFAQGMEDGPDQVDGKYDFNGNTYRLEEAGSEVWSVYDGDTYLGVVRATEPAEGE